MALTPGLAAQDPDRALDLALELPDRVARADGRRLLLFFDEFQEVASARRPYGDPDAVTNRMRAVFQRTTSVSYLFAGSIEHVMRDLFAPVAARVQRLRQLLRAAPDRCRGVAARAAASALPPTTARSPKPRSRSMVELGGGHPRATMRIAQQVHLVSIELDTREIDLDLVQVGFERALEGDRPTMEQIVERIRLLHKNGLLVARTLAADQPLPRRLHPGVRDRVLKLLRDAGVVEHESRGRWRVIDPLLRRYLVSLDPFA